MEGNEVVRHSSDEEPFSALAFKIMADPFVGKLAFFRVYSGTMNSGSYVYNSTKDKKERVGRILQMHANKRAELDKVYSGDIAAAVGFKVTTTGDTICDEQHPVILESMELSSWLSSRRPKLAKANLASLLQNWQKRTRLSVHIPIRKLVRLSLLVWVSFIWRSSLTVCFVSSR